MSWTKVVKNALLEWSWSKESASSLTVFIRVVLLFVGKTVLFVNWVMSWETESVWWDHFPSVKLLMKGLICVWSVFLNSLLFCLWEHAFGESLVERIVWNIQKNSWLVYDVLHYIGWSEEENVNWCNWRDSLVALFYSW